MVHLSGLFPSLSRHSLRVSGGDIDAPTVAQLVEKDGYVVVDADNFDEIQSASRTATTVTT